MSKYKLTQSLLSWILTVLLLQCLFSCSKHSKTVPFKLPQNASDVKYQATKYQGIGFEEYLRFSLPADQCVEAAKDILNQHDRKSHEIFVDDIENYVLSDSNGPKWFNNINIRKGKRLTIKDSGIGDPAIFIDTEKGIVYYILTD